ncbi:13250_t:CDS:2, partial [Dentiscutata erythropus]
MAQAHYPTFKYTAQFNLSRNITTDEPPMLQSINETITNASPPFIPLTDIDSPPSYTNATQPAVHQLHHQWHPTGFQTTLLATYSGQPLRPCREERHQLQEIPGYFPSVFSPRK